MDIALPVPVQAECRICGRMRARFEDPAIEAEYRAWRAERAVPFARVAMLAATLGWIVFGIAAVLIGPDFAHLVLPVLLVVALPQIAGVLAVTYRLSWRRFVMPAAAVANAISGTAAVLILWYGGRLIGGGDYADIGATIAVVFIYYACTIMRLPPGMAALAVAPYVVLQEFLILDAYAAEVPRSVAFSSLLTVALVSGLLLSVALERQWRSAFQQDRLIEAQRQVIEQERERSEKLLHSILPEEIAQELKDRPGTVAQAHEAVTVLFADLCGFTPLAAELAPEKVVGLLNEVFSRFDELCEQHGVEKIKTIGDAYMAVAGVPQPRPDHAEACANLALAMRAELLVLAQRLGRPLDFRIGMHTGPVIAGVIGTSKFAYDLWGDTVNVAARMETHGVPGEIQVTDQLAARLRDRGYQLRERGVVQVKGKGDLNAWFLDGRPRTTGAHAPPQATARAEAG